MSARACPDEGRCHHGCLDDQVCWRVRNAEPLSGTRPADEWETAIPSGRYHEVDVEDLLGGHL